MSCCGSRERDPEVKPAQKWEYINLGDFNSSSCFTPVSYVVLWIMLGISIACYIADFSTMINLLLWDKYGTNGIRPPAPWGIEAIPRWVFTGCIILSYVLLIYRWMKALRAMRSGGIAKSYLDPLAARIQSIRPGQQGRGYRRFLVFAELTKSKHGTEYIALFVYFAFEAWLRIIFAEGPRNVINGYTIYHLIDTWENSTDTNVGDSGLQKFWSAAVNTANQNGVTAAVYIGMLFTCVIWLIAFIGLMVAFVLYIVFLWHHIPRQDGGLRGYCKRKIDKSLEKIVSAKIKKALEQEQKQGFKRDARAGKGGLPEAPADLKRQPTLPVLSDEESQMFTPYTTRPGTPSSVLERPPTLPDTASGFSRPGMPSRTATASSNQSFGSDAPLLRGAADVGHSEPGKCFPPGPVPIISRPYSPANGRSASPAPPPRPFTPTGELITTRPASPSTQRPLTPAGTPAPGSNLRLGPPIRQHVSALEPPGGRSSSSPGQVRQQVPANSSGPGRGTPGPFFPNVPRSATAMSRTPSRQPSPYTPPPPRSNNTIPHSMQGLQSSTSFHRPAGSGQRPNDRSTYVQEYEMTSRGRQNNRAPQPTGNSVGEPQGSYSQGRRTGSLTSPGRESLNYNDWIYDSYRTNSAGE